MRPSISSARRGGTLEIIDTANNNSVVDTFSIAGPYTDGLFTLASDGGGGTDIGFATQSGFGFGAGDVVVSNVLGQPYSAYEELFDDGTFAGIDYVFTAVSGAPYSAYEYDYSAGNQFVGSQFYYTNVAGEPYTAYEYDYDAGGDVTGISFSGVSGAGYSSYRYTYVGDIYDGATFAVTTPPAGATFSSYELDYDASDAFIGDRFFFTATGGEPYTSEEADFNAVGQLTRVLLSGVTGQAYSALEEDYSAGTYTGYKAFYAVTGQAYTEEEVDVSAANRIAKVIYSGLGSTPYSSVEDDYANGALSSTTYDFTNSSGQGFYAYQVQDDANGNALRETVDNDDGSHLIVGFQSNQTFDSIADDTFTGGGSNETFVLASAYGHDTITDFSSYLGGATHDTIAFAASDFSTFAAVLASAQNVGGNTVITAPSGNTLTLDNVSTTALAANAGDVTFHS